VGIFDNNTALITNAGVLKAEIFWYTLKINNNKCDLSFLA
jgi:hypothetical protein